MLNISKVYNPGWHKDELIRNLKTGEIRLIIHIFTQIGTMVVDATKRSPLVTEIILRADYDDWVRDRDLASREITTSDVPAIEFSYQPMI